MELILIRHGLPEKVVARPDGPADPNLAPEGHAQAHATAAWLKDHKIDRLYSSPMRRAFQTAEPLATHLDLEIDVRDGVAEFDRDHHTYVPVEELKKTDYKRWQQLMDGTVREGFPEFAETVIRELTGIVEENSGNRVAVTCHGGVINVWTAHTIGFEPRMFFNPGYASVNRFMISSGGVKTVVSLNESAPAP